MPVSWSVPHVWQIDIPAGTPPAAMSAAAQPGIALRRPSDVVWTAVILEKGGRVGSGGTSDRLSTLGVAPATAHER